MIDPPKGHEDHPEITSRNSRYGLILFAVYLALYGAFMLFTVFDLHVMALPSLAGVNVAIVSGVGLIVAALLLSCFYVWLCRPSRGKGAGE
jgi:uncharacterized membrane protein (DUF485 family)